MQKGGLQLRGLSAKILLPSHCLRDWTQFPTTLANQDFVFSSPAPLVASEHTWSLITPILPRYRQSSV